MPDRLPRIGELRNPVVIARRVQSPSGAASISETYQNVITVMAKIENVGSLTFLAGEQTERGITHRIVTRWLDWIDETFVILRQSLRLDQTTRTDIFRIRRVMELGYKQFLQIEVEQETRQ